MNRSARAWLIAAAFAPAVGLKVTHAFWTSDPGVDGGYYTDVAKHVRDGEGISTSVSLYHQGFETFPHASPIYPIWPLLYGWTARILPLESAGVVLSTAFWGVAIVFAALWARRVSPGDLWAQAPGVDAGHVLAMLLALNGVFFRYTSHPYTEGVSFAMLFAGLWWFHPRWRDLGIGGGFALGFWLGLLVLVRSQLVIVAMAAACALAFAVVCLPGRGRRVEASLACASAFVATLTPQLLRLAEWTEVSPWTAILRFEMAREHSVLSPMDVLAHNGGGMGGHLSNFAAGLPVAFTLQGPMTYWKVFHGFQYALPIALGVLLVSRVRVREWFRPERLPLVFAFALAAGGFLSLHFLRKDFTTEWHFARRHALTALFAFFLAWLFLVRHPASLVRAIATALVVFAIGLSHYQALKTIRAEIRNPIRSYEELIHALHHERERNHSDRFVVALSGEHAQRVAWRSTGIGIHWIYEKTSPADLEALARLGVRWLLLDPTQTAEWPLRAALGDPISRWRRAPDVDGFERYTHADEPPSLDSAAAQAQESP